MCDDVRFRERFLADVGTCKPNGRHFLLGKAIPLQLLTDPEGSRRLRLPDFKTNSTGCGKVVSPTHRPPLLHEISLVIISVRG
jgi:hypothetical protein